MPSRAPLVCPECERGVRPADLLVDPPSDTFTVNITALAPGPHVVTLRATDALGNAHYKALQVELK